MSVITARNHTQRQSRPSDARSRILKAAAGIFSNKGLAGARTDAIAVTAGVNKALLYYYFKSKESLYQAVIEEHFGEFNRNAIEVLKTPGPARTVLLRYAAMHFDFISSKLRYAPLFHQLLVTGGKPLDHLVQKYFVPRSEALGRLLERGMRGGEFRRAGVTNTSISIVALIVFYFSAIHVLERLGHADVYSRSNLKRRRQETLDFIRHGIFLDPEAPLTHDRLA